MPTDQPANATDTPATSRDDATAAAVLADERLDDTPGGGGLGGQAAGRPSGQGGATPNSPIDVPTPGGAEDPHAAEAEAQRRALKDGQPEDHPSSL